MEIQREQMNVVIVGHVDHGKSTLVGRLLADTGSLPEGKLEAVKAQCKRNAKPFEYAFYWMLLKMSRPRASLLIPRVHFLNPPSVITSLLMLPGILNSLRI